MSVCKGFVLYYLPISDSLRIGRLNFLLLNSANMVTRGINHLLASLLTSAAILSNDEMVCSSVHRARNNKCVFGCAINELPGLGDFPTVTFNITGVLGLLFFFF